MMEKGNLNRMDMAATCTSSRRRSTTSSTHEWSMRLNETLSAASRRLFQSQLVLRAASEQDIRAELPDLCALATSLCEQATSSKQRAAICSALSDPQTQWLSRGAVQSGASGFFCHLLLRGTAQDSASVHSARLVIQLLLDPVLSSCAERDPEGSNRTAYHACEWRFEKPKYYAMACASLWGTLSPFIARAARQHPNVFSDVLDSYLARTRHSDALVNCRFAQVAGLWRLLEALSESRSTEAAVIEVLPKILSFTIEWCLLRPSQINERDASRRDVYSLVDVDSRFYDLLMDKFFQEMHDFLFKCANAATTTRIGLANYLKEAVLVPGALLINLRNPRLAAITASACLLVKGLAEEVGNAISRLQMSDDNRVWIVGCVSHVDSIDIHVALHVVDMMFDLYDDETLSASRRRELLGWILYIAVSRQRSLRVTSSQTSSRFVRFQERLCAVAMEDLQLMPLHWMENVWKVCFSMNEEEVGAFTDEARAFRLANADNEKAIPLPWEALVKQVPFRHFEQYPAITTILGSSYAESLQLVHPTPVQQHESVIEEALREKVAKKRRLRRDVVVLTEEQEESRQSALLLPEVMERICTFMSAKRLCRLSLVCKAFATVAKSDRVWESLYVQLVRPLKIKCQHGSEYQHDWRVMSQAKYVAIRKMRNRQREANRKAGRQLEGATFCWHEDENELRMSLTLSSLQLCRECGCNQMFGTDEAAKSHRLLHQKYRCPREECRASLTSALALKQHVRSHHPLTTNQPSHVVESNTKPSFACMHDGCKRSYKSAKWLENHIQREHQNQGTAE